MELKNNISIAVFVEEEGHDERAFASIDDNFNVEAGEYYTAGQPDADILFTLIRHAEVLTFNGKRLKSLTLQEAEETGAIELWLCF